MWTKVGIQIQLVYQLDLPCKVNFNLPSSCQLTTATHIFRHLSVLLSEPQIKAVNTAAPWLLLGGVKSLVRRESPLSFQLPRHFTLTNCEGEVVNDMKSLFTARAGPRPPDGPCFSHAAGPLRDVLNNQRWSLCSWEVGEGQADP